MKQDGYSYVFEPTACNSCQGNCCIGESGYIWISQKEIISLAEHLNMKVDDFVSKYLFKKNYRYSIREVKLDANNFACCFFDMDKKQCSIYEYRPSQCRTFPFWEYFKNNIEEITKECPAVKVV